MQNEPKTILTHAFIEQELRFYNAADRKYYSLLFFVLGIILIPLAFLAAFAFYRELDSRVGSLLIGLLIGSPVLGMLVLLVRALWEGHLLRQHAWDLLTLAAVEKTEEYRHRTLYQLVYFKGIGKVEVSGTHFALAEPGDLFYLICYRSRHRFPKLVYLARLCDNQMDPPHSPT